MRIWYSIIILFYFHSLSILVEEQWETNYVTVNKTEKFQYFTCFELTDHELSKNRTPIELNLLNEELYNFFDKGFWKIGHEKRIDGNGKVFDFYFYRKIFDEVFLKSIKLKSYVIFEDNFCFVREYMDDDFVYLGIMIRRFSKKSPICYYFDRESFDSVKFIPISDYDYNLYLEIRSIEHKEFPYSNCLEKVDNKPYRKQQCIFKCLKKKFNLRLSKYFFDANESGLIYLNYQKDNQTVREKEIKCFQECKYETCKFIYMNINDRYESFENLFIEASASISKIDYWIQFIGLISLFSSISLYQFVLKSINLIILNKRKKIKLNYLKSCIMFIGLICFLKVSSYNFSNYQHKILNPVRKNVKFIPFELEPFRLVLCTTFTRMVPGYNQKTFKDLEKSTDFLFNLIIEDIYLLLDNKKIEIHWKLQKSKILFRRNDRCFLVDVRFDESRYESQFLISKLKIQTNESNLNFFILSEKENFNSENELRNYPDGYEIVRKSFEKSRLNGNCLEYEKIYNCNSRWVSILKFIIIRVF